MECRLGEPSLPQPRVAFIRKQAKTEDRLQVLEGEPLEIVLTVVLENMLDVFRIGEKVGKPDSRPKFDHVAVGASGLEEGAERIAA